MEESKDKPNIGQQLQEDSDDDVDYSKYMQVRKEKKVGIGHSHQALIPPVINQAMEMNMAES